MLLLLLGLSVVEAGHVQRAVGVEHLLPFITATGAPSLQLLPYRRACIRKDVGLVNKSWVVD